jgi:hypothetical protein
VIRTDKNGFPISSAALAAEKDTPAGAHASNAAVQAALANLAARPEAPKLLTPGEMTWKLTTIVYPAVLLVFVALYVSSLSAGAQPEIALLQAGGVGVVLAVLGRLAVGILGDDFRLVLNDAQIAAMTRSGAIHDILQGAAAEHGSGISGQPSTAAPAAGTGGKE